jgi:hypothetical protein
LIFAPQKSRIKDLLQQSCNKFWDAAEGQYDKKKLASLDCYIFAGGIFPSSKSRHTEFKQ